MSYYNTNCLSPEELKEACRKAAKQEECILTYLKNRREPFSPSEIHERMQRIGKKWPIQSVRRALTNLQKSGDLVKTDLFTKGPYGAKEHKWKINVVKHPTVIGQQQTLSL